METRSPSLVSRVAQWIGLGAHIPQPSGPLPVRSVHFRVPGGVFVQCFFPIAPASATNTAYEQTGWARTYRNGVIYGASEFSRTPYLLMKLVLEGSIHPLAEANRLPLQIPLDSKKHPVVLFSHGLGGSAETYTKQCSDLASSGYVVIALEHEDGSGAHAKRENGEVVAYIRPPTDLVYVPDHVIGFRAPFLSKRKAEVEVVLEYLHHLPASGNELARVMDLTKIAMAGHSFGSATSVYVARTLPPQTFCGLLLLDVWSFPLPDLALGAGGVPVCSILSEPFAHNNEAELTRTLLQASNAMSFYLPGTVHSSFSDTPWWLPAWLGRRSGLLGKQDPDLAQAIVLKIETAFLASIFHDTQSPSPAVMKSLEAKLAGQFAPSELRLF
ncbi:hypothetical protein BASA81_003904 [Batrachochytrium salamandrivorans]|nr:hypothetical protein BASA81_003904 [Batrachochytrium salamandrivorans]